MFNGRNKGHVIKTPIIRLDSRFEKQCLIGSNNHFEKLRFKMTGQNCKYRITWSEGSGINTIYSKINAI